MRNNRLYLSVPMDVPWNIVMDAIARLKDMGYDVRYWKRGSPYDEKAYRTLIENCDTFVLMDSRNRFKFDENSMTSGSRKELSIHMNKDGNTNSFLYYQAKEAPGFYIINPDKYYESGMIEGIAGSARNIKMDIDKLKEEFASIATKRHIAPTFDGITNKGDYTDKRTLLLLRP